MTNSPRDDDSRQAGAEPPTTPSGRPSGRPLPDPGPDPDPGPGAGSGPSRLPRPAPGGRRAGRRPERATARTAAAPGAGRPVVPPSEAELGNMLVRPSEARPGRPLVRSSDAARGNMLVRPSDARPGSVLIRYLARWTRLSFGLALGAGTAVLELLGTLLGALALLPVLASPRGRAAVLRPLTAAAHALTRLERARLARLLGVRLPGVHDAAAARYLAARWPLGVLGAVVLGCGAYGLGLGTFAFYGWLITDIQYPWLVGASSIGGFFLLFLAAQGALGVAALEDGLARRFGPSNADALEARIAELATSRAEVMDVVHDERRRIERDLHDGVQQRLVALGMLIGRARRIRARDPEGADALLLQAHEESRRALAELREVAWRVYPAVLDEGGLRAALETVAERSTLPVGLAYTVERPLPRPVETVAYFLVSEAVTNVVKHAGASRIDLQVTLEEEELSVRVTDDGAGGADASGSGLSGLASRTAALDGRFAVESPAGGPTVVRAVLPCA
ncbi:sensor histidine kinase [Streptomyces sp. NPDC056524]|uniref:sensor histidine kinase n=1 Tax=Streptomyces sp. NPDC056524 TaxID=3345851 RepID=UPI0036B35D8E